MPPRKSRNQPVQRRLMRFWWRFIVVALVVYVVYTVWLAGAYRSAEPFVAGQCIAVDAPAGPEDMAMLPDGSAAVVSAQDRRNRSETGALYLYDLDTRPRRFMKLNLPISLPFHPHGIALHQSGGQTYLQVINHRSDDKHTVEIFTLHGDGIDSMVLRHRGSVSSNLFVHPNGIAAVGPESFYLTNDRGEPGWLGPRWTHRLENLLQLSRSTVVYHDGRGVRTVAEDIAFANGIEMSANGGTVLVGSTLWRMILTYTRDPGSGALFRSGSISLPGGVDNIRRDSSGAFWLAAHPNAFAFVGHATDPEKESPSMVLRIGRDGRGAERLLQAFGDPGDSFSGASGAVQHDNRLLIGATFGNRIMDCQIDPAELREVE